MMGLNPWLLLGGLLVILASFFGGVATGKDLERTEWLEREVEYQKQVDAETKRANEVAMIYGKSLLASQDTASRLRRELNNVRNELSTCLPGGGVRFTDAFVGLFNDALQTNAADSGKFVGPTAGADDFTVLETHIENGRRWKSCRSQLNALIDVLEDHPK
jgi:hypothetical protein